MPVRVAGLTELLLRWDLENDATGLSPLTRERFYCRTLRQFLSTCDEYVTDESLVRFLSDARARGLSPFTVRGYHGAIRRFFTWAHQRKHISHDPLDGIRPPKVPKRERILPPEDAIQDLIRNGVRRCPLRDRAIVTLAVDGNLRLDELRTLRLDRVYLHARVVVVRGKGNKERPVGISPQTLAVILRYLDHERPPSEAMEVFLTRDGHPFSRPGFAKIVPRLRSRTGHTLRTHDLRHLGATLDARSGMNPYELKDKLGHVTMKQTLDYTHLGMRQGLDGLTADRLYRKP